MEHVLHFIALTFEHFEVSHYGHHVAFAANGMLAISLCYHGAHFVHEVRHKRRTKSLQAQAAAKSAAKGNRRARRAGK